MIRVCSLINSTAYNRHCHATILGLLQEAQNFLFRVTSWEELLKCIKKDYLLQSGIQKFHRYLHIFLLFLNHSQTIFLKNVLPKFKESSIFDAQNEVLTTLFLFTLTSK